MNTTTIINEIEENRDVIIGTFHHIKMQNYANGYTIFVVRSGGEMITCTGKVIAPKGLVTVKVTGTWTETSYGRQLQNAELEVLADDPKAIYEYVINIPSIGEKLASAVANAYSRDSLFSVLDRRNPEMALVEQADIGLAAAEKIVEALRRSKTSNELFRLLAKTNKPAYAIVEKLFATYGERALDELKGDPYRVGMMHGLDFDSCDIVAGILGNIQKCRASRIVAAAETVLNRIMASSGDCCCPTQTFITKIRKFLAQKSVDGAELESGIEIYRAIREARSLKEENSKFYSYFSYQYEVRCAKAIRRIINSGIKRNDYDPDELCAKAEEICGLKHGYAEQQREAFKMFRNGGLCILTGGPGTGKTTVVKGLLAAYEELYPNGKIKLCAPTGRASQRMKEATGREASTVHRLLEYRPYGDHFLVKDESNPIDADLIVVDESSMISIDMADMLFRAVKSGTMVLLVGDTAQLPSVGAGNVLNDIIRSGVAPVFQLTKTHRQGAGSPIIENANRINSGIADLVEHKDFRTLEYDDTALNSAVRSMYYQYHRDKDPFSVQILTLTKRAKETGCYEISNSIQGDVNKKKVGGIRYGKTTFYVGDKVMMMRNNYNIGYFNGDVGLITKTSREEIVVDINGEEVHVPNNLLEDMSLAYACTIHKSQGSEYETVIIILPNEPQSMLQRNLLYTAVTRAKQRVILISSQQAIFSCATTVTAVQRETTLCERLRSLFDKV